MTGRIARMDGITAILSMPFDRDEEVIPEELCAQVDFLDGTGVRAVGFGYGTEITRLTEGEIWDAFAAVTDHVGGRLDVMATVGGGSIKSVVKQGVTAKDAGADVLMMRPPPGSSETEITTCCVELSQHVGLPIVFQDAPEMTMVEVTPTFLAGLIDRVPEVVALKIESADPAPKIGAISGLVGDTVSILGGAGGIDFLTELDRGAHGTVPFVALAPEFVQVHRLHAEGRREEAEEVFGRILPLVTLALRSIDIAYFTFKELLRRRGVIHNGVRLRRPAEEVPADFLGELEETLAAIGGWDDPGPEAGSR